MAPGADAVRLIDDDARQQAVAVQRAAGREADSEVVLQGRSLKGDMEEQAVGPAAAQRAARVYIAHSPQLSLEPLPLDQLLRTGKSPQAWWLSKSNPLPLTPALA